MKSFKKFNTEMKTEINRKTSCSQCSTETLERTNRTPSKSCALFYGNNTFVNSIGKRAKKNMRLECEKKKKKKR